MTTKTMPAKVILNPYAGRWMALKRRQEAEAALQSAGIVYELVVTAAPNHGEELAAQAVREGFSPIISAGGDGSISEVINGIAQAAGDGPLPPLGILPLGSANDLVDNLGLPRDLSAAAGMIAAGKTCAVDLCQVNGRYFGNNSAVGLEPYITLIQQKIHRVQGIGRYLLATLRGIADNPRWVMRLEWEDGEFQGLVNLVTVGNSPRTGGLFYMTPHADPFDGLLTFVYGAISTRSQLLRALPMAMKPAEGNFVEHPDIFEVHSPWLRIISETPTPLHADGEIQSTVATEMEYRVLPGRLNILLGR